MIGDQLSGVLTDEEDEYNTLTAPSLIIEKRLSERQPAVLSARFSVKCSVEPTRSGTSFSPICELHCVLIVQQKYFVSVFVVCSGHFPHY